MSLSRVPLRQLVRITGVRAGGSLTNRLLEMGLVEGTEVCVLRRAPLGDPLQVRLGDYELSLRASEADLIETGDI